MLPSPAAIVIWQRGHHQVHDCGDKEECAAAIPEKVLFLDLQLWVLQKNSYWFWPTQTVSGSSTVGAHVHCFKHFKIFLKTAICGVTGCKDSLKPGTDVSIGYC